MDRTTRVLIALDGQSMTVPEMAEQLGQAEILVRRTLTGLIDRVLVRATRQHPSHKRYELTTLGKLEADRIRKKVLDMAWMAPIGGAHA